MASSINSGLGRYWLLYLQPEPESGEKIAAAVIFQDDRSLRVEYDSRFAKVHKIYPNFDVDTLRFYLESLKRDLTSAKDVELDLELTLASYGPQLVPSGARRVAVPISDRTTALLCSRYILPEKARATRQELAKATAITDEIAAFVRSRVGIPLQMLTHASSMDILGRKIPGTKPVSLAVQGTKGWTLIDGVDLNKLAPKATERRADDIARNFWSYTRHRGLPPIKRVGIVLNGNSHLADATHEAHDYALHRFQVDADLAIDGASVESGDRLKDLLTTSGA